MGTAPRVRIASTSGRVAVRGEPRDDVVVDGQATITEGADGVDIEATGTVTVRVPEGTDVVVGARSGRTEITGRVGTVRVVSESGRVEIDKADAVDVRTSSSRVEVGEVAGACCVRTESGSIEVNGCGTATVSTNSGGIEVREARGDVRAHCVSGRISIEMAQAADVVADAVTGRVSVRFPEGVRVREIDRDADATVLEDPSSEDADCTVTACSVSGKVEVSTR